MVIEDKEEAKALLVSYYSDSGQLKEALESDEMQDVVSEIADSSVDIYTYDLMKWNAENYCKVEEAIDEFGAPDGFDMVKAIMMGQYMQNEEYLYEALEELKDEVEE